MDLLVETTLFSSRWIIAAAIVLVLVAGVALLILLLHRD